MSESFIVIHFASHEQVDGLFRLFAKPEEWNGAIDWVAPAWWYTMYATAECGHPEAQSDGGKVLGVGSPQ